MQQHSGSAATTITVTVYSRPGCVQCNATYRTLGKAGIEYDVQDAMEDANNALLHSLEIQQAPGVIIRENAVVVDSWGGFRPDKIEELVKSRDGELIPA